MRSCNLLTPVSPVGNRSKLVICCGSKKSSKLTFSRFTEVLTVVIATYGERPYVGGIFTEGNHSRLTLLPSCAWFYQILNIVFHDQHI